MKFKGEILSEILTELLRQDNITVPDERSALPAVLQQKSTIGVMAFDTASTFTIKG